MGIRKTIRNFKDNPWVVGIVCSIIGGIFLTVLGKRDVLVKVLEIVWGYMTIRGIIITTACFIAGGIVFLILSKRHAKVKKHDGEVAISREDFKTGATVSSPTSGLCLGRDTELSQLEKDVTSKNVLLIKGIAGIGKTTLGLKFRDTLEKRGYHTLWYQCDSESYEGFLIFLSGYLKTRGSVIYQVLRDQGIPGRERLKTAVQELCTYPTIVFLDNFQVLDDSGFGAFKDCLRNSTLVLMSRVQPGFLLSSYENLSSLDSNSSLDLLKILEVKESPRMLEKIYEKTGGHPWSLVRFADLARVLPVKRLLDELPVFGREQENYLNEECWKYLNENEKEFLMRASVFTKPLTFEAVKACGKKGGLSQILPSLARKFCLVKREGYFYIHEIIKDFVLSKLKEDPKFYAEAERAAAAYYDERLCAENLLLIYDHLKEAGDHKEGLDSIIENIDYFWREGYWSDAKEILEKALDFFKEEETKAIIYFYLGTIVDDLGEWDKAIEYYEKDLEILEGLGDTHGMAKTYGNLGPVYARKGELHKAIEC
ncbi:MAG: tetratricopeptide repeat protein [Candidatus Methanofastidiosia archaeon]